MLLVIGSHNGIMCVTSEEEGKRGNTRQDNSNGELYDDSSSDDSRIVTIARRGRFRANRYELVRPGVTVLRNQESERLDAFAEGIGLVNIVRHQPPSPLHQAIENNDYSCVIRLLEYGADPNHSTNKHGSILTPLRAALRFHASLEIMEALMMKGATLNGQPNRKRNKGNSSIIMAAADEGCTWYIKHLLKKYNVDPGSIDPVTGESLLHKLAKQEGALWLIKELVLAYGRAEDVCKKDKLNQTPIGYADLYCQSDIASFLRIVRAGQVYRDI